MKKKDYRSLAYALAQAVGLVEEDEPTKKEAKKAVKDVKGTPVEGETKKETIEFEQGLAKKTPKKKYFGGATRPEDVDTKAAIKSHSDSIKAAGQAAVKKAQARRDAEDKAAERAENQSTELFTRDPRVDEIIGDILGAAGKVTKTVVGAGGKVVGAGAKVGGKLVGTAAKIPGDVAGAITPKKKAVLAHTEYKKLGYFIAEFLSGMVSDVKGAAEGIKSMSPAAKAAKAAKETAKKGLGAVTGTVGAAGKAVGDVAKGAGEGLGGAGGTKEKKTVVVAHTEYPESGSMVSEYAMLAGTAVRALGGTALRRGAVAGGRKAAVGGTGRKVAAGARKLGKNPEAMEKIAQGAEAGVEALQRRKANKLAAEAQPEPTEDSTQYNNAYVRKLMEAEKEKSTSHPSSTQSRLKKELGSKAYEKLSSRPNDPSPVEAARAKRKGVSEAMAGEGATAQERKADRERAEKDRITRREAKKAAETKTLPTDDAAAGLMGLSIRKPKPVKDWTEYHRLGKVFLEWEAGPIAKRIASQSPAGAEGRMSDTKGKKISPDPVADRETKKTAANVDKKLSDLASPKDKEGNIVKGKEKKVKANLKVKDVVQGGMNRRRAAAKAGKSVEGSPAIPPETREQARVDALEDKRRRMAPGDK